MPNWCSNYLIVEGDLNELKDFKSKTIKESDNGGLKFTMEELLPTPKDMLEDTGVMPAWYNWRVENWGTKWDTDTYDVDENDELNLKIGYNTAWAPNEAFIKYASDKYPNLKFKLTFEEAGMGFCGILVCENGEVTQEETTDLEWIDEETDRKVYYDGKLERYKYEDNDEVIDDEDFYPQEYNPFNF
jgi:hypothetical protein